MLGSKYNLFIEFTQNLKHYFKKNKIVLLLWYYFIIFADT